MSIVKNVSQPELSLDVVDLCLGELVVHRDSGWTYRVTGFEQNEYSLLVRCVREECGTAAIFEIYPRDKLMRLHHGVESGSSAS
jgi:hypothetical protein